MTATDASLYDEDFYAWTQEQAELLRRVRPGANGSNIEHIAEEIEDLGKGELHACQSLCEHIIEHLLKLEYSGLDEPTRHWRQEIIEWRLRLGRKLTRTLLGQINLSQRYGYALRLRQPFGDDVPGLMQRVPAECPYSLTRS